MGNQLDNSIDFSRLISPKALPPHRTLSMDQGELSLEIMKGLSTTMEDRKEFVDRLVRSVATDGDVVGFAYPVNGEAKTLLSNWLLCEIETQIYDLSESNEARLMTAEVILELDKILKQLASSSRWSHLQHIPHPTRNRLAHCQYLISQAPAFRLVSSRLHRGLCGKLRQLQDVPKGRRDELLGSYARSLARITNEIPAGVVKDNLNDYTPGEFDRVIDTVIAGMKKIYIGRDGRTSYAVSSLKKYRTTWFSGFYNLADDKKFHSRRNQKRNKRNVSNLSNNEPDVLPSTHPVRAPYIHEVNELKLTESADLSDEVVRLSHWSPKRSKNPRRSRLKPGNAVLLRNPSPNMTGVLPKVVLALAVGALDNGFQDWPKLNRLAGKLLIKMLLHTGRNPEWLLDLELGEIPNSIWECPNPVYVRDLGTIFFKPRMYLGLPERLRPDQIDNVPTELEEHDAVFESILPIYVLKLPEELFQVFEDLLIERSKVLADKTLEFADLEYTKNRGHTFLQLSGGRIKRFEEDTFASLFREITKAVRTRIPEYPLIKPTMFLRSFDAYYNEFGVDGVSRYNISERSHRQYEMPVRYSRIHVDQIFQPHQSACTQLEKVIASELNVLGIHAEPIKSNRNTTEKKDDLSWAYFGSWRCTRLDVIREIVKILREAESNPLDWFPDISPSHARYNVRVWWVALTMALLNGMRHFEVVRLKRKHVDLDNLWIAVKGKPHGLMAAFRRLPISLEVAPRFQGLMNAKDINKASGASFLGFYGPDGRRRKLTTKDLEGMLKALSQKANLVAPVDYYGLRHRFRSDMLFEEMPEPLINYLMGHETSGTEVFNIYREADMNELIENYREKATRLAEKYGILPIT